MSQRRSPKQWRLLLSAFHHSGQSQSGFCSDHGLSVSSLRYQLRRDRSRANGTVAKGAAVAPRLLEVVPPVGRDDPRPSGAEPHPTLRVECSLDSPRLSIQCPPELLARLLGELSALHQQREARP